MCIGLFCIRYPEMMLETEMHSLIDNWLTKDCASKKMEVCIQFTNKMRTKLSCLFFAEFQVLRNLHNYLKEVELQLKAADIKCKCILCSECTKVTFVCVCRGEG